MQNTQAPPVGFNNSTRQSWLQLPPIPYSAGGVVPVQLPQVGFLSKILLYINANITTSHTGTSTANLTNPTPDPFRIIKRIRLATNEGSELVNLTSEGLYLMSRIVRSKFDFRNPSASISSTNTAANVFNIPATFAIDSTYDIRFPILIPVAWGEQLQAGLILLQNPVTRITLEVTFGDAATDLVTLSGGGTVVVNSCTCTGMMEIFNVPEDVRNYPDLSVVHLIREETVPLTNVGVHTYRPSLGNTYLDTLMQFENNGARMVPLNFTLLQLTYAQTQNSYSLTPQQMLFLQRYKLGGIDLPDGVFWWNFDGGFGLPEIPNTRDVFDTARITDLQLLTTVDSSVTLTNAQVRVVNRMLARIVG